MKIGFVAASATDAGGEQLAALVPAGLGFAILSLEAAKQRVAADDLAILVVALDGPSWQDSIAMMDDLLVLLQTRSTAVFALVPRDYPAALVRVFDLGVADAAGLPIDPDEVRARLAALVRRRQTAMTKAAETRAVWQMAVTDPVTGLYNRNHLDQHLPEAIDGARRRDQPLALLMIDLDALKPFNDRWGHAAGDRILRSVAEALRSSIRVTDTIARYGGDEIVVVMPDTEHAAACAMATGLVKVIRETRIARIDESPVGVTISVGVAALADTDMDAQALLARADRALYAAKRAGRDRIADAA